MAETPPMPLEGVLYTDGGCRSSDPRNPASRGHAGWGMHGYIFTKDAPKVGAGAKKGVPGPEGYDIKGTGKGTITLQRYVDGWGTLEGEGTNNQAELMGAMEAIKLAITEKLDSLLVRTDSKYVVQGSEWLIKWKANHWVTSNGSPVSNIELWRAVDEAMTEYKALGGTLAFKWVKGHNGAEADPGNVLADRYATRAVLTGKQGRSTRHLTLTEAKGYWKAAYEHHRMLSLNNWYFTTSGDMDVTTKDGKTIYYLGDIKTSEEFLGKRISDASFAVVYLKEPEPILERLRKGFGELSKRAMQGLIVADLATIFRAEVHDSLMAHGEDLMVFNRHRQSIEHMDRAKDGDREGMVLGHEIRPTRLAYTAINVMESLEAVLNEYLAGKLGKNVRVTEITDVLYERSTVKDKVKVKSSKALSVSTKAIEVEASYASHGKTLSKKVCLTLNQDLPDRNTLAALASPTVKVLVVTWPESPQAFRFATIVTDGDDAGLWAGPYANLQLTQAA